MRHFLDELDGQLAVVAREPAPRLRAPSARVPRTWRRLAAGGALAAAGALAAVGLGASSSPELPVFGAPQADASALAGRPGVPPAAQFDLASSRVFLTPDGPGHVIESRDGRQLCIVLPDRVIPGSFGSRCARRPSIDQLGLAGEMVEAGRGRRAGRALVAFVLPARTGTDVRMVEPDGTAIPVAVHDGVAVAALRTEALLRFDVGGRPRQHRFEAPFGRGTVEIDCGRHAIRIPAPEPRPGSGKPWALEDRLRYCH